MDKMNTIIPLTAAALTTMGLIIERDPNPHAIFFIFGCLGFAAWWL